MSCGRLVTADLPGERSFQYPVLLQWCRCCSAVSLLPVPRSLLVASFIWPAMGPRRDHRAQPWTAEQVSQLGCTTLHVGAEAICVGGVHFPTLRGRLLLITPPAAGSHESDAYSYGVRIAADPYGKVYTVSRDHLESPDEDTPRPQAQDDGLLGPRLRWQLFWVLKVPIKYPKP